MARLLPLGYGGGHGCCRAAGVRELGCANVQAGARCRRMRMRAVDEIGGCRRLESGVHGRIKRSVGIVCKARLSTARVSESVLLHVRITTWTG